MDQTLEDEHVNNKGLSISQKTVNNVIIVNRCE